MDNFPQGIKDFPYVQSNIPEGIEDFPYGKTVNPSAGQGWEVVEKYISSQNCAGCEKGLLAKNDSKPMYLSAGLW